MTNANWLETMRTVLDSYNDPAVLVDADYNVVVSNSHYDFRFGGLDDNRPAKCYFLSHGYNRPCDLEGETCPMHEARETGKRASVLHIHNTPQGKEHVGIETIPIVDEAQRTYFIEVMKPILEVSAEPIANKMIGRSKAFNRLVDLIQRVGKTNTNVLLMGASGTGKELAAQAIHSVSSRASKPFVTVECSGLTDTLFESELFGHMKGAFTGATYTRTGLVQSAHGGTLFLDEVGDIPLHLQVKLLRLIETKTFRPVGDSKPAAADFRLVCATHKDLISMVERGEFREDLYHRISTFPIRLPALSERREDLPLLVKSILLRIAENLPLSLTEEALALLCEQAFKGNIRELKNIIERAIVLRNDDQIDVDIIRQSLNLLPVQNIAASGEQRDGNANGSVNSGVDAADMSKTSSGAFFQHLAEQKLTLEQLEQAYLHALLQTYPDKAHVADIAGCSLRTLYRKLDRNSE
ncbi:sigma-54 interaction domain-containing protein [Neptunomonas antarctica]|uniref:Sigma54 specific transcriptional regulator, Fis family n=1 Tax=Neptunomonas antarctica TaxID=619304 RepID=A0A1N7IX10_9GAMM|nr:sigma 54-interacting transcriptional regulator [Neptunomonas antarctica]SIS41594.1 sigma54 specific transcriptional regulator, Fis family [Neptunomonas antarctica]